MTSLSDMFVAYSNKQYYLAAPDNTIEALENAALQGGNKSAGGYAYDTA